MNRTQAVTEPMPPQAKAAANLVQPGIVNEPFLEPELAELASGWSRSRRIAAARKLRRWCEQLVRSAEAMKPKGESRN